jgi:hypothetical protein
MRAGEQWRKEKPQSKGVVFWQLVLDVFEPAAELERCNSLFFLSSSSSGSDNDSAVPARCPHGDDERKTIQMMKNRESALCSRTRKRVYMYLTS